ncbi:MAG: hypothetical protein HYX24_05890 [Candidatus Aenigmarchaeota archaeon]|nr:hypothetical protein [Candidatus Aenigmarchaeota archaeon]
MEVLEEKFVPQAESKKILKEKAKLKELAYEQKNALEFLDKFVKVSPKDMEEIVGKLREIEKLQDKHMVAILDFLPETEEDLRLLFSNEIISLNEEEKKKILDIMKKIV